LSLVCEHFNQCGSCHYNGEYDDGLNNKISLLKNYFGDVIDDIEIRIYKSSHKHFRDKMEFKIFHKNSNIFYAMYGENKKIFFVNRCEVVNKTIFDLMPKLLEYLNSSLILKTKLYQIEFLSSKTGKMLLSLIYHRKLQEEWILEAKELEKYFDINVIGRSRKQKINLSDDVIVEKLTIRNKEYIYENHENSFTQANSLINEDMISWAIDNIKNLDGDLLELYCGSGNFTIPFSDYFNKVLATEVSKSSILFANKNKIINNSQNIELVRMSSSDLTLAINGVREFRRLKSIDLNSYNFSTIFVDPPRAGVDRETLELMSDFEQILYISCNYETLYEDLKILLKTHRVSSFAIFDQFAYSKHLECGIFLKKIL